MGRGLSSILSGHADRVVVPAADSASEKHFVCCKLAEVGSIPLDDAWDIMHRHDFDLATALIDLHVVVKPNVNWGIVDVEATNFHRVDWKLLMNNTQDWAVETFAGASLSSSSTCDCEEAFALRRSPHIDGTEIPFFCTCAVYVRPPRNTKCGFVLRSAEIRSVQLSTSGVTYSFRFTSDE